MRYKERKGKRQDPRQSGERENSKVRVLGFKNAYRLERVISRIKDWEKIQNLKNRKNKLIKC